MDIKFFVSIAVSLAVLVVAIDNVPIAKEFVAATFQEAGNNIGSTEFRLPSLSPASGVMPVEMALESFEPPNVSISSKIREIRMSDAREIKITADNKNLALTPALTGSVLVKGFEGGVSFDAPSGLFSFSGKAAAINTDLFSFGSDKPFQISGSAVSDSIQLFGISVSKLRFEKTSGAITYNKTNSLWLANTVELFNFAGNMTLGNGIVMKGGASSFDMVGDKARVSVKA